MDEILTYIVDKAIILIPVLIVIGALLKQTPKIPNWLIPYILLLLGIAGGLSLTGFNVSGVIQGVLVTGVSVYGYEAYKALREGIKGEKGGGIDYGNTIGQRLADFNNAAYKNQGILAQCVWYVRGRGIEKLNINTGITGNANLWFGSALKKGIATGADLKPDSIVCFNFGTYGHVLYIEHIIDDKVYYTECNVPMDNKLSADDGLLKVTTISEMTSRKGYQGCIYLRLDAVAEITVQNVFGNATINVDGTGYPDANTYIGRHDGNASGSVWNKERVQLLKEDGSRDYIRYNLDRGGSKEAWINSKYVVKD